MNTKQIEQFNSPMAHYFDMGHNAGYSDGYCQAMKDVRDIFSKPELDFLVAKLSRSITIIESFINVTRKDCNYFYSFCNPEDESTSNYFKHLNEARRDLRKLVKRRNKLAAIQSKLKKLRSA